MSSSRKFLRTIMVVVLTVCLTPAISFAQEETMSIAPEGISDGSEGVGALGVEPEMKAIPAAQNTFDISKEDVILEEGATTKEQPAIVYQSSPDTPTNHFLSVLSGTQYVKLSGVNLSNNDRSPIWIAGSGAELYLELAEGSTNVVQCPSGKAAGVGVEVGGELRISGTGKLKALQSGGSGWAAIGGGQKANAGNVVIEGGEVEATGAVGIGGYFGNVLIQGGVVKAIGTVGGGVVGLTIDIQGGSIDAQATDGPGIGADKTQFNGSAIAITGGVVKAKGGGTGAFRWDIHAARIQIRGGNVEAADSPLHIPRNQEWKNANAKLYPVKLKVAPNADLSAYQVLFAENKRDKAVSFPYNLQGVKANAKGEAWLWLPSGVAKLQKKTVSARASYALGAETNDVVESFIAIVMEDGSSIFVPDLSEEFSIQGGEGAFGQVTVDTAPILLRNGAPLASDDKGAVSWFYSFGPNDEDVCASWESLLTECGTDGVLNVGTYGVGATYITGEDSEGLGLVSGSFEVIKKELLPSMVADVPVQTIVQGSQATPAVSVTDGELSLIKASDYAITYGANNVSGKGTGSVTVTATDAGNYFGSVTKTFDIGVSSSPGAGSAKMAGGMLAKTGDALGFGIVSVTALFVGALMVLISARWLSRRRK